MPPKNQRPRPRGRDQHKGDGPELMEKLLGINRVAKVHKGGKRLAFNALAVVGDGKGRVGMALGKSNEAADAIRKGFFQAQRNMITISLKGTTIPHRIIGHYDAARVLLQPASPGTGIIAGGPVRAVCEAAGIRDILTKRLGSSNAMNLVKATLSGLQELESADTIRERRKLVVEMAEGA
jgi:small subunit ribosomal protein S5